MDLKNLLNEEQYEAATTINGPLLILAGAGSGKTRVITYRIAHMIKDLNIYPSSILAITFTNKAAKEMKERVQGIIGGEAENMWISTFHSTCVRILRREVEKIGYNKNFIIYDSDDQKTLIKQCMKELNIDEKSITDKEIIGKIGEQKDNLISPEEYERLNESNYRLKKISSVYTLYQKKLKANNAMDFDDLIGKTVELFVKNPDVLEFYRRKFKYIMVDEYQDTNKSQYELVKLLAKEHKNICVVGDDDQCIYQWRGADIRNILDFEKDYENTKIIKLEKNYRSMGNILNAANEVIRNNVERKFKVLKTDKVEGDKIRVYRATTENEEAFFVASEIKKLKEEVNLNYRDFCILYRTNSQSRTFENAFIKNNIPYRILSGTNFYSRKEIKDILSYLKVINNPLDEVSLRRIINVPKRGIGDTTVEKILSFGNYIDESMYSVLLDIENVPDISQRTSSSISKFVSLINSFIRKRETVNVSNLIEEILETTGYLDELLKSKSIEDISRVENIKELVSAAVEFENNNEDKTLSAFLEQTTLVADVDKYDENADAVVLMTVHSAKGLEFPVVFMVGMENGIFPGAMSLSDPNEMEESRRLCYVGITRAMETLYMTSARSRLYFGKNVCYPQSEFISEISEDNVEMISTKNIFGKNEFKPRESAPILMNTISFKNTAQEVQKAMGLASSKDDDSELKEENIKMGKKVKHMKFGVGTIVSVDKNAGDINLTIAFDNMGIKKLRFGTAPLQEI